MAVAMKNQAVDALPHYVCITSLMHYYYLCKYIAVYAGLGMDVIIGMPFHRVNANI